MAALLKPLNLTAEESIRLVEQLYGSVLDMDVALAGEADDTRKSSTLAYIQNTTIRREGDKLVVEYPTADELAGDPRRAAAGGLPQARRPSGASGTPTRPPPDRPARRGEPQPRRPRCKPARGPKPGAAAGDPGRGAAASRRAGLALASSKCVSRLKWRKRSAISSWVRRSRRSMLKSSTANDASVLP